MCQDVSGQIESKESKVKRLFSFVTVSCLYVSIEKARKRVNYN